MMLNDYKTFLDEFFSLLASSKIDVSLFRLDHIAYYTSSASEYENLLNELTRDDAKIVDENIVGDRRVALLSLREPLIYEEYRIGLMELIEPLPGESTLSRWEHVELTSGLTLEQIVEKYPDLAWDTSRMDRKEFPMLKLKLSDTIQVKFPRRGAMEEVSSIKSEKLRVKN